MRALILRGFTFVAFPLALIAAVESRAAAQARQPRPLALAVDPIISTAIESLLSAPNLVLVTDYYRIDMRFGPSIRIDAVIVEAIDSQTRMKGVRVQVRDPESRSRQDGTSYIDLDELVKLTHGLTAMAERAGKWVYDDRQATDLSFTTAGGFRIAIRQSARVPRAYLSTGLLDPVVTSIDLTELPTVKHGFDQALAILNSK